MKLAKPRSGKRTDNISASSASNGWKWNTNPMPSLASKAGTKVVTSKKDFCRLLKGAHLLSAGKKSPAINEADVDAVGR